MFVKLSEFVEETRDLTPWDEMLQKADSDSQSIYTSIGSYGDQELFSRLGLSAKENAIMVEQTVLVSHLEYEHKDDSRYALEAVKLG